MRSWSWPWKASIVMMAYVLMWFPTVLTHISEVDSPRDFLLGAPLPWRSPSISASLAWDIYLIPAAVDAAFWLLIATAIIRALKLLLTPVPRALGVALFLGLALAFGWAALWTFFILLDPYFLLWYPENLSFEGLSIGSPL